MVIVLLLTRIQARLNHVAILRAVIVYLMIVIIAIVIAIGQEENGLNRSMLSIRLFLREIEGFLDCIGNAYKYVVRDKDCKLFVCKDVHTDGRMWFTRGCVVGSDYTYISGFEVQFPMVNVISPTVWSIEDLKKLDVVEEYGID